MARSAFLCAAASRSTSTAPSRPLFPGSRIGAALMSTARTVPSRARSAGSPPADIATRSCSAGCSGHSTGGIGGDHAVADARERHLQPRALLLGLLLGLRPLRGDAIERAPHPEY